LREGLAAGRLRFTNRLEEAADGADVLWVAYDTPVDDDDVADTEFVDGQVKRMLPHLAAGCVVIVSSQLPVGSVADLEAYAETHVPGSRLLFAASPENLRLGKALESFRSPDRIVVGVRDAHTRQRLEPLFGSLASRIEWMSVESAEMTKHAINAFLAVSVTFAKELAKMCEAVSADAKDVERGLKTDARIGARAYVAPGAAFAGGTLARDIAFLGGIAARNRIAAQLLNAVRPSNQQHKDWIERKLEEVLPDLRHAAVAIWGLTYKPGTDTLRRSPGVELCRRLADKGVSLSVHDPVVQVLPSDLALRVTCAASPLAALCGADALAVCTEWPQFKEVTSRDMVSAAPGIRVVDPNRFLAHLATNPGIDYYAVGTPKSIRG
jgi:UDPglucose 6-dehydrogenase